MAAFLQLLEKFGQLLISTFGHTVTLDRTNIVIDNNNNINNNNKANVDNCWVEGIQVNGIVCFLMVYHQPSLLIPFVILFFNSFHSFLAPKILRIHSSSLSYLFFW